MIRRRWSGSHTCYFCNAKEKGIFAVGHRENNKLAATHRQRLLLPSTIMKSRMFVSGHRLHYNKEKHQWGERNIPK
jgi:hypothetical protein